MHVCVFLVTISSFLCSSLACVSMVFLSFSSWMRFSLAFCSSLHFTATLSSTFWELSINPWPSATTDLTLSSTSCRKSVLERRHSSQGLLKALISIRLTHPCICVCGHMITQLFSWRRLTQTFFSWLVSSWRRCSVWAGLNPTSEKEFSVSVACSSSVCNYKTIANENRVQILLVNANVLQ